MWRARASTGLVLASIGRRNRPLGWMHSPRRKDPLEATKHIGVTDVVPLHHQVYPRLRDRLSLRDRPDRSAVRAEARPERTGRNVAFGCCGCSRVAVARTVGLSDRARPLHDILSSALYRSG